MSNYNNNLTLTNDALFKEFFSHKGNEIFLKSFLSDLLKLDIETIEISKDNHVSIDNIMDKTCVLDIRAIINNNIIVNLEMQNAYYDSNTNRFSTYGSKLINSNLNKGETYDMLKPTLAIWILNYELFDFEDYITEAILVPKNHREVEIPMFPKYYFIELSKFMKSKIKEENNLNDWLTFIDGENKEEVQKIMSRNTTINDAVKQLEELLANKEVRRIVEAREKNIMDYESMKKDALTRGHKQGFKEGREKGFKDGIEQGLQQGIQQGIQQGTIQNTEKIVRKMLDKGLDINIIAELTSLSVEEIKKLN